MSEKQNEAALERALVERDTLVLLYQPIHQLTTRRIVAAEALLRQRRRTGELREAGAITTGAEVAPPSELLAFDRISLERAFHEAVGLHERGLPFRINVNLSSRELQENDIERHFAAMLEHARIDPELVNLEVTEASYIHEPEKVAKVLESLRRLGPQIWLDDFGWGHSSLAHLLLFPVSGTKIPAEYVKRIGKNPRAEMIVESIVRLAHRCGLQVVAEGVETGEQLAFLAVLGCDFVQGFLWSRPMELANFEATLGTT